VALNTTGANAESAPWGTLPHPIPEVSRLNEYLNEIKDEAGQTMAEYAVVLGVITIAVVVTLGLLSAAIKSTLTNVISSL
jgi:Flp pilus assembly pilin Flp